MRRSLLLAALLAACAAPSVSDRVDPPRPTDPYVVVTVENDVAADQHIYVAHEGMKGRHLGDVTGYSTARFVVRRGDVAADGDVYLIALPFPEGRPHSTSIPARAGEHWTWRFYPADDGQGGVLRTMNYWGGDRLPGNPYRT